MTEAKGIHALPTRKLGRRPENTSKPKLAFADYLKVTPAHPIAEPQPNLDYPMDHNDVAGDCVVAAVDHALQIILTRLTGSYTNWSDALLLRAYQSQNPDFRSWDDGGEPSDGGMYVAEFLSWCIAEGFILGYAKVNVHDYEQVKAAIYLGLAIVTGQDLRKAQQSGKTWDYVPDSPEWGGHATVWGGYRKTLNLVTWGDGGYAMTDLFVQHQVSEAYFVITQEQVDRPDFRAGYDLAKFAADYKAITGRDFPAPVPAPTPAPAPPPFLSRILAWLRGFWQWLRGGR